MYVQDCNKLNLSSILLVRIHIGCLIHQIQRDANRYIFNAQLFFYVFKTKRPKNENINNNLRKRNKQNMYHCRYCFLLITFTLIRVQNEFQNPCMIIDMFRSLDRHATCHLSCCTYWFVSLIAEFPLVICLISVTSIIDISV